MECVAVYSSKHLHNKRREKPKRGFSHEVFKSEVRLALTKIKKNKTTVPDEILIETLSVLDNFRINKVTKMITEIYGNGKIPEDIYSDASQTKSENK